MVTLLSTDYAIRDHIVVTGANWSAWRTLEEDLVRGVRGEPRPGVVVHGVAELGPRAPLDDAPAAEAHTHELAGDGGRGGDLNLVSGDVEAVLDHLLGAVLVGSDDDPRREEEAGATAVVFLKLSPPYLPLLQQRRRFLHGSRRRLLRALGFEMRGVGGEERDPRGNRELRREEEEWNMRIGRRRFGSGSKFGSDFMGPDRLLGPNLKGTFLLQTRAEWTDRPCLPFPLMFPDYVSKKLCLLVLKKNLCLLFLKKKNYVCYLRI